MIALLIVVLILGAVYEVIELTKCPWCDCGSEMLNKRGCYCNCHLRYFVKSLKD